jgi:hypothetical protein
MDHKHEKTVNFNACNFQTMTDKPLLKSYSTILSVTLRYFGMAPDLCLGCTGPVELSARLVISLGRVSNAY